MPQDTDTDVWVINVANLSGSLRIYCKENLWGVSVSFHVSDGTNGEKIRDSLENALQQNDDIISRETNNAGDYTFGTRLATFADLKQCLCSYGFKITPASKPRLI